MKALSSMLCDGIDGSVSSRRVVTLLAFLLCAIAFIANLFFKMKIDQFIFDSMSYIAMAGLGATVAEKFSSAEKYSVQERYRAQERHYDDYQPRYPSQDTGYYTRRGAPLPRQQDPLI